jgi:hypothetical protein
VSISKDSLTDTSLLRHWISAEQDYRSRGHDGRRPAGAVKICGNTASKVIFTAPHAVNHLRDGEAKNADIWTGSLAETLAFATGNCSLTVNSSANDDPNWDLEIGTFKGTLARLLDNNQVVIDLHGMKDDYDIDICIGLGPSPNQQSQVMADSLADSFCERGLRVSFNWPFSATRPSTITSFVQSRRLTALQVEVAAKYRQPKKHSSSALLLLNGFLSVLVDLQ